MNLAQPDFSKGTPNVDGGPLLPVVTQDHLTGQVLMLAWMNAEAFAATLAENRAVYFSRSRGELWRKGDTSGHFQELMEVRVDCDADAILLKVRQTGAACHKGYQSCFFRSFESSSGNFECVEEPIV